MYLTQHNWDLVDGFTTAQGHMTLVKASSKQKDKFSRPKKTQYPTDLIDKKKVVVKLSNKELDPVVVSILAKGLNFTRTTNPTSNIRDVMSGIERAVLELSTEVAATCSIFKKIKTQKNNSSKAERNCTGSP
jgi:hypothetical protein